MYYIEYKNKEILLGSNWNDIMETVDRNFPHSDMMLNLAVKINLWEELRTTSSILISKQDVEEILILYGKYRDRAYWVTRKLTRNNKKKIFSTCLLNLLFSKYSNSYVKNSNWISWLAKTIVQDWWFIVSWLLIWLNSYKIY